MVQSLASFRYQPLGGICVGSGASSSALDAGRAKEHGALRKHIFLSAAPRYFGRRERVILRLARMSRDFRLGDGFLDDIHCKG